jgi:hypothetical protein
MLCPMASETGAAQADASELESIAWHWEKAYKISHEDDVYVAVRIGYPNHRLTADTPAGLRSMIRSDYGAWLATLRERSSL